VPSASPARTWAFALLFSLVAPLGAAAQEAPDPATPPPTASRLVLERVENGFAIAPDIRFGEIDGRSATFVGGYGGWMTDRTLLIGAGGYWLANSDRDVAMAYGGAVVEWLARGTERIGFGTRALVGGGSATLPRTFGDLYDGPIDPVEFPGHRGARGMPGGPPWIGGLRPPSNVRVLVDESFFIFEPQANVLMRVTDWLRVNAGVGYRVIAGADLLGDDLRGLSGTVAVQFGGGR
jgi:hypothetical protein